jgi:hypothetical protein
MIEKFRTPTLPRRRRPTRSPAIRLTALLLEDRVVPTVAFTAADYATPTNNPDLALGSVSNFIPIEPMISVNPRDPANIAASSHRGLRLSTNLGTSYANAVQFTNPTGTTNTGGDTDTAFNADGRLFWSNLAGIGTGGVSINERNPTTGALVPGSNVNIANTGDDKEFIAADASPTSPFKNNLYMAWMPFGAGTVHVRFSRSTNNGLTWSTPIVLSAISPAEGFVWPVDVRTAANGDVYVAYHSQPTFSGNNPDGTSGQTFVLRSTDGGLTFPQKNQAFLNGQSDVTYNVQTAPGVGAIPQTQFWMQGAGQPWVLPDPVRPGNVYVITSDDPNNVHGTPVDDVDVVIARSTDNGQTWTRSTLPFNPVGGSHQFFPTASIDQFGNIAVAWYDNRRLWTNAANRFKLDVFASYSRDGGLTWATPFMVNDSANPFNPDIGAANRFAGPPPTTRIGEYFGIDLFANTVHLVWNGPTPLGPGTQNNQQVVYDRFAIPGTVTVSGDDLGTSDDAFVLSRMPNSAAVQVTVNGVRQYAGLLDGLTLVINGLAGNDTLTVDYTNGNPIPAGGLTYNGGGNSGDTLTLTGGTFTTVTFNATNATDSNINLDGSSLAFTGLASISSTATATNVAFHLTGGDDIANLASVDANNVVFDSVNGTFVDTSFRSVGLNTLAVFAGGGDDAISVDSNGSAADGTVNFLRTAMSVDGEAGNNALLLEDSSDTTADIVTVDDAHVGLAGDTFFGTGGSLTYLNLSSVTLNLSNDSAGDVVNLTPAAATAFTVNANNPTSTTSVGDRLSLNLSGVSNPVRQAATDVDGQWSFGNRQPVIYTSIEEQLASPPGVSATKVNDGASQRSRVTDLTVTFNSQVTFATTPGAALTLTRISDGAVVTFTATASLSGGVTQVIINNFGGSATQFGSLADGRYMLTALADQITVGGVQLDGNGDGTPGDNYTFGDAQGLFRFFGDINGDRHVDIADFGLFTGTFNLSTGQTGFLAAFDFNGDGHVDIADFGQFSVRFFTPLP